MVASRLLGIMASLLEKKEKLEFSFFWWGRYASCCSSLQTFVSSPFHAISYRLLSLRDAAAQDQTEQPGPSSTQSYLHFSSFYHLGSHS